MRQNLNMISLGVKDIQQSIEFYENTLGWEASKRSKDNYRLYNLGGIILGIYPIEAFEEDLGIDYQSSAFSGFSLSYNATSEQEVDDIIHKINQSNGSVIKAPEKVSWGGYRAYFKDPDGYLFEIVYNPFWELDEEHKLKL